MSSKRKGEFAVSGSSKKVLKLNSDAENGSDKDDQEDWLEENNDTEINSDDMSLKEGREASEHGWQGKTKRKKVGEVLNYEQEDELAKWFEEHPMFYDQSQPEFKNKLKKERLLEEKGKDYGISGDDIMLWFKSQRTMFGRLLKRGGHGGQILTARQHWVMRALHFLSSHVLARNTSKDHNNEHNNVSQLPDSFIEEISGERDSVDVDLNMLRCDAPAAVTAPIDLTARTAWTNWMSTELIHLNEELWSNFQKDSFELVMRYKEQNQALHKKRPQQQQQQQRQRLSSFNNDFSNHILIKQSPSEYS